jgi:hypothetical protein
MHDIVALIHEYDDENITRTMSDARTTHCHLLNRQVRIGVAVETVHQVVYSNMANQKQCNLYQ